MVTAKQSPPAVSESVDDYLKAILGLGGADGSRVQTNALAEHLGVRTPSVTGMLQKLAAQTPSLVVYEKHHGVQLSAEGRHRAWELVRHHRLLELFLHDVLKYSWDEVHDEAERLEHFISERFEDRVAAILGDPEIDPHGHVIPRRDESGVFRDEVPLAEWPLGTRAVISSVSDRDAEALRALGRMGLVPGTSLIVEKRNAAGALSVQVEGRASQVRVGDHLTACILVAHPSA